MLCLIHFWVLNVWHFPSHVLFSFLQPPTPVPLTAPLYLKYPLSLCVSNLLFSSGWHFHLFISFSIKKKIFWWPILKFLFNLLQYYFCFFFFGPEVCAILAPWPGIDPTAPALEAEVLITEPPGKSLVFPFLKTFQCAALKPSLRAKTIDLFTAIPLQLTATLTLPILLCCCLFCYSDHVLFYILAICASDVVLLFTLAAHLHTQTLYLVITKSFYFSIN